MKELSLRFPFIAYDLIVKASAGQENKSKRMDITRKLVLVSHENCEHYLAAIPYSLLRRGAQLNSFFG